jgi:hypothetical protein
MYVISIIVEVSMYVGTYVDVHESEIIYIYKMSLSYKKHSKNAIMPMCKYRQNQTLHYLKKTTHAQFQSFTMKSSSFVQL